MTTRLKLLAGWWLAAALAAKAATITATAPAWADVSNAVASASAGDTVSVPAGTANWSNTLVVAKSIALVGDSTVLVDELSRAGDPTMLYWRTTASGTNRLSGFTFRAGTGTANGTQGAVQFVGTNQNVRIDHCNFQNLFNVPLFIRNAVFGVCDHCNFTQTNWQNDIEFKNGSAFNDTLGYGDASWATPLVWPAQTNWFYIENCTFWHPTGPAVDDYAQGGLVAFRYNLCTNTYFQCHGTESSQRDRGARAWQVYNNLFYKADYWGQPNTPFQFRSGTGVIYSNAYVNYPQYWSLVNFRSVDRYTPWGSANGQNLWDSNNPSVQWSGIHTGTNNAKWITDSGSTWTNNQWTFGYVVQDTTLGGTNSGAYSIIYSNDAHSLYYLPCQTVGFNDGYMAVSNAHSYAIYRTYAQLDQVGRGLGDRVDGDLAPTNTVSGIASWPREASEPLYTWGNTWNGNSNYVYGPNTFGYHIMENRDYIENTVRPGYTNLVYPHPLTSSGFGNVTNTSPAPTRYLPLRLH